MTLPVHTQGNAANPPLILLHGLMMAQRMWAPQVDTLAKRFNVLVPDLPGYGASPGPFSLDGAATQVITLMDGRDQVHLCGLSLGAMVALRVAAWRADQVRSLVLSGVTIRTPRLAFGLQGLVMKLIPEAKFSIDDPTITKAAVLSVMRALAHADLRQDLPRVTAHTLVLCGFKDRLNLRAARRAAAGIPGAELRMIPGAGHVWNLEQPELFNRTVTEWAAG
jgi:3-oxoadipate enol-lactonase